MTPIVKERKSEYHDFPKDCNLKQKCGGTCTSVIPVVIPQNRNKILICQRIGTLIILFSHLF